MKGGLGSIGVVSLLLAASSSALGQRPPAPPIRDAGAPVVVGQPTSRPIVVVQSPELSLSADATSPPSTSVPPSQVPAAPPPPPPMAPTSTQDVLPPASQWTRAQPGGQWVYTADDGWIWVPNDASMAPIDDVPYVYLYTATYGWTWYVSPWGWGPYRYGAWVRHPWRPAGWRGGWVARPHVVVRLHGPSQQGFPRGFGYGRGRGHGRGGRR